MIYNYNYCMYCNKRLNQVITYDNNFQSFPSLSNFCPSSPFPFLSLHNPPATPTLYCKPPSSASSGTQCKGSTGGITHFELGFKVFNLLTSFCVGEGGFNASLAFLIASLVMMTCSMWATNRIRCTSYLRFSIAVKALQLKSLPGQL
jgi:hypothetical protein